MLLLHRGSSPARPVLSSLRLSARALCLCPSSLSAWSRHTNSAAAPRPVYAGLPSSGTAFASGEQVAVDHVVVGGGAVGLAVAAALAARFPTKTTYLLERHAFVGMETSSRNSEVVHAGLYYPPESYKTALCLRGRALLYRFCDQHRIPVHKLGKLVVGTDPAYFDRMQAHVARLPSGFDLLDPPYYGLPTSKQGSRASAYVPLEPVPLERLTGDQARSLEPDLSPAISAAILSPETGIVDSHTYMQALVAQLEAAENAEVVLGTSVVGIRAREDDAVGAAFALQTITGDVKETLAEGGAADELLAKVVVNAAGLDAPFLLNQLLRSGTGPNPTLRGEETAFKKSGAQYVRLSPDGLLPAWYSKGNYASYSRSAGGVDHVKHLIYPTPNFGANDQAGAAKYAHQSLGTHLTLDLDGNVRFGPDSEWLTPPTEDEEDAHLKVKNVAPLAEGSTRIKQMGTDVHLYLPALKATELVPAYSGIRPKLVGPPSAPAQGEAGFVDFLPLFHTARGIKDQPLWQFALPPSTPSTTLLPDSAARNHAGAGALVSLLGIESPGLTSSLAIGEMVAARVARGIWGDYNPATRRKGKTDDIGGADLDAWA